MKEFTQEEIKEMKKKLKAGWGPKRPTYTCKEPAKSVAFNSITDNVGVGDERNFVRVMEVGSGTSYRDCVCVRPGYDYEVFIYIHNNAASNHNLTGKGIARDVKVASGYKSVINKDNPSKIYSVISCSNSDIPQIWDCAVFATDYEEDIELLYVTNSAKYHTSNYRGGIVLPKKEFFSKEGTLIGSEKLDGTLYGCAEFSGYITYRVRAVLKTDYEKGNYKKESDSDVKITEEINENNLISLSEKRFYLTTMISEATLEQLIQLRDEFGFSEKWNPSDLYKSDESELEALFKRLKEIKKKS